MSESQIRQTNKRTERIPQVLENRDIRVAAGPVLRVGVTELAMYRMVTWLALRLDYEEALVYEFKLREINFERQKEIMLKHKGKSIGLYRINF